MATISRVLNHPEKVLPDTRRKVMEVMQEQNYTPNWFARGLNMAKTSTIALLVPNIESNTYQEIISGVETVVYNKQNTVILGNNRNDAAVESAHLGTALSRRVDGIVLVSSLLDEKQAEPLITSRVPFVHIGRHPFPGCETSCYLDYQEDVERLVKHLVGLGHRRIDLLLDSTGNREAAYVETGFSRVLADAACTGQIWRGAASMHGGYVTARKMIHGGNLPHALVTMSDTQAFGVMRAAQEMEIPIPEQFALAAMTDSEICSIVTPPLTSMEQPTERLGMVAARMLFDEIENRTLEIGVPREVILQSTIKIRKSCGNTKYIYELQD